MKKDKIINIILVAIFLVGLSLLLYPTVSDYINDLYRGQEITDYVQEVAIIEDDVYNELIEAAKAYNVSLLSKDNPYRMTDEEMAHYNSLLNVAQTGMMGYIEIPLLGETMPLFHGVEERVLQTAIGHLEWTSLPIGGESTHSVVSGHRGLPSARLFTDLDKLTVGEIFMLHILDETITYQIDQILTVEPHDTDDLLIVEGKDYCTLVTCTPYGINSHRLLIRGERIENIKDNSHIRVTADALVIEPLLVAPVVAAPILLVLLVMLLWPRPEEVRRRTHAVEEKKHRKKMRRTAAGADGAAEPPRGDQSGDHGPESAG